MSTAKKISHVAKNATFENLPQFQFKTEMHGALYSISDGAPPQTPPGELKALLRPLAGFKGSYLGREERRGHGSDGMVPFLNS